MPDELKEITDNVITLLTRAYERGYADGAENMRSTIMRAAGVMDSQPPLAPVAISVKHTTETQKRAPKGLLTQVVTQVLRETPGLTLTEIEARAVSRDDRISSRSIGNELRRLEGSHYRREDKRWFISSQEVGGDPAQITATHTSEGGVL